MNTYVEDNSVLPNVALELLADHSNVKLMFLITFNLVIETFDLDCFLKVSFFEVTDKEMAVECVTSNTDDHSSVKQSSSAPANYIVGDGLSIVFKKITKSVKISLYIKPANKLKREESFMHLAEGVLCPIMITEAVSKEL